MEKKRILFVINSLKCGGAETLLKDILNNIDYSKFEVFLLTFEKSSQVLNDIPSAVKHICTLKFGGRINHYFRKSLQYMGLLDIYYRYKVRKAIPFKVDTIVSFLEGFPVRAHSYLLDKSNNHISFIHTDLSVYTDSSLQFEDKNNKRQDDIYQMMDKLVFVSNNIKDAFCKVYPNVETDKNVLINFIDKEKIQKKAEEFKLEKDLFTIVSVGRITYVKGYDLVLDIAEKIKASHLKIQIKIVGDGPCRNELKRKTDERFLSDIILWEGYQANPYPYLKNADVFISTSFAEGLPLAMSEAMFFSLPIVSTKTAGAVELLSDGFGILVERDPKQFFEEIQNLYRNPQLRIQYGEKSHLKSESFDKQFYMTKLYSML